MIVEDFLRHIQKLKNRSVNARVIDIVALFARDNKSLTFQNGKLLRNIWHLDSKLLCNLRYRKLPLSKLIKNSYSERIGQRLKEVGLKVGEFFYHVYSNRFVRF